MIGVRNFTVTTDSIKPLPVHHSTADFLQRVYKIPLTVLHLPTLLHNVAVPTPIDYPLMVSFRRLFKCNIAEIWLSLFPFER